MNCASRKITGGSNERDAYLSQTDFAIPDLFAQETPFPAMFVANILVSACTTAQGTDVKFPNSRASVENASADKADILALPTGSNMEHLPARQAVPQTLKLPMLIVLGLQTTVVTLLPHHLQHPIHLPSRAPCLPLLPPLPPLHPLMCLLHHTPCLCSSSCTC